MLPISYPVYGEGYSNYLADSQSNLLVESIYPTKNTNELSNNTSADIWWHYPTFTLGSYKQITNNIKYPNSPDEGTCMPASMCGALYDEKYIHTNYIKQLPPNDNNSGKRVGYFDAI
jgi:hypothetical protein